MSTDFRLFSKLHGKQWVAPILWPAIFPTCFPMIALFCYSSWCISPPQCLIHLSFSLFSKDPNHAAQV